MQQVIIHSCGNPRAEFGCRYIRGAQWATVLTIGAGDDDNEGDDNDDGTVHALGGVSQYTCMFVSVQGQSLLQKVLELCVEGGICSRKCLTGASPAWEPACCLE